MKEGSAIPDACGQLIVNNMLISPESRSVPYGV